MADAQTKMKALVVSRLMLGDITDWVTFESERATAQKITNRRTARSVSSQIGRNILIAALCHLDCRATVKLLIVDELGYVPFTAVGSELLFEVFSQRYERGATLVTSNLPFDEWTSIFGSPNM